LKLAFRHVNSLKINLRYLNSNILILYQIHNIALTKNYIVDVEHHEVVERTHMLSNGTLRK